jgi:hypothetical protein
MALFSIPEKSIYASSTTRIPTNLGLARMFSMIARGIVVPVGFPGEQRIISLIGLELVCRDSCSSSLFFFSSFKRCSKVIRQSDAEQIGYLQEADDVTDSFQVNLKRAVLDNQRDIDDAYVVDVSTHRVHAICRGSDDHLVPNPLRMAGFAGDPK